MKPTADDDLGHDRDHGREGAPLTLAAVLKAARAELNLEQPPAFLFAPGLSTPVNVTHPGRPVHSAISARPRRWATGLVACLGVMLLSVLLLLLLPAARPPAQRGIDVQAATTAPSGFLPLVPAAQLAAASRQPSAAWLIAADMPRDRLAALGLPFDPARAGENVRTELLVNPAGEVLALRLLY